MAIGIALAQLAIGAAQGLHASHHQGKKIERLGEEISRMYQDTYRMGNKLLRENNKKTKESAKKIKIEQHNQAKVQFEFNKEEIKKSLEKNLRGAMSVYVTANNNLVAEIKNAKTKLAFTDVKNVEDSSYKHDSQSRLKQEADDNAYAILNNQLNGLEDIQHKALIESYQSGLDYNRVIEGINQNYLSTLSNSEIQLYRDLGQLQNFVSAGQTQASALKQQGFEMRMKGMEQISSSIMDFGKGLATSGFGKGTNNIKEIPRIFNNENMGIREVAGIWGKGV